MPVLGVFMRLWKFREGQTYLSPAPLYHAAPWVGVSGTIRLGGTVIVMERFDEEHFLQLVEAHRVTHTQLVPTMFSRMLKLPEAVRRRYDVSSLESAVHAAAPCPIPVKRAMIDWWGPTGAIQSDAIMLRIFVIGRGGFDLRASCFGRACSNRRPSRR